MMVDIKMYSMIGCKYCHEYIFPRWRLNAQLPLGSKATNIDIHLDPRFNTPRNMLGEDRIPLLTITKTKVKPLFFSDVITEEYTQTVYTGVDSKSNYALLKSLISQ